MCLRRVAPGFESAGLEQCHFCITGAGTTNYQRDLDLGAGYHLNQDTPVMHAVETGDSLWAFTRTSDGRYVLAAELVVQAKTMNRPDFRYGKYRVWGISTGPATFGSKERPVLSRSSGPCRSVRRPAFSDAPFRDTPPSGRLQKKTTSFSERPPAPVRSNLGPAFFPKRSWRRPSSWEIAPLSSGLSETKRLVWLRSGSSTSTKKRRSEIRISWTAFRIYTTVTVKSAGGTQSTSTASRSVKVITSSGSAAAGTTSSIILCWCAPIIIGQSIVAMPPLTGATWPTTSGATANAWRWTGTWSKEDAPATPLASGRP